MKTGLCFTALILSAALLSADELRMSNGDHYIGKVMSVDSDAVVLRNDNLGTLRLPRNNVTSINLDASTSPQASASKGRTLTNALPRIIPPQVANSETVTAASVRQIKKDTNLVNQVRSQVTTAGPGALAKFDQLIDGLDGGQINLEDLRSQAKSAADQLRGLKSGLGEEEMPIVDEYLSILDGFVKQTGGPVKPAPAKTAKAAPVNED